MVTVMSSSAESKPRLQVRQEGGRRGGGDGQGRSTDGVRGMGKQPLLLSRQLSPGVGWAGGGPCRRPGGDSGRENCTVITSQSAHVSMGCTGRPKFVFTWNLRM